MCIENDPTWKEEQVDAGLEGMKIARSIALISYRHYEAYSKSQSKVLPRKQEGRKELIKKVFKAETYQRYQGENWLNALTRSAIFSARPWINTMGPGQGTVCGQHYRVLRQKHW